MSSAVDVRSLSGRREWIVVAILIVVAAAGIAGAAHFLIGARLDRWQPARSGDVLVIEKISNGSRGKEERLLRVRLDVPAASPVDAAKVPANTPDRDALIGPRTFELEVPVEREKWNAVTPGVHIRAMYQLNLRRTKAFVPTLYLDALAPPR